MKTLNISGIRLYTYRWIRNLHGTIAAGVYGTQGHFVLGYFGYLPDISFAVEGNRILLQLQADVNGV